MNWLNKKSTIIILSAVSLYGVCAIIIFLFFESSELSPISLNVQADPSTEINDESNNLQTVWIVLTFFSISITGLASLVALRFYNWRQKVDLTGALVPEEWAEHLLALTEAFNSQANHIQKLSNDNVRLSKLVESNLVEILKQISSSKEMLLTFQSSIQEKDVEINRLKLGYDFKIQKDLLSQLVQLHSNCSEIISKSETNKGLTNIEFLIRDILEGSGVLISKPSIGTDFSKISDQIEVVGYSSNSSSNLDKGQISEVLSDFYMYDSGSKQTVLKPAKIKYHLPDGNS
jgi:hypothetical protein